MTLTIQKKKTVLFFTLVWSLLSLTSLVDASKTRTYESTTHTITQHESEQSPKILPLTDQRQLVLGELDALERATFAHIQLKDAQEPTIKRKLLHHSPAGWHNYHVTNARGTKSWLMNRGHLIGYQFSGLNNEAKNLATMTAYLNTGFSDSNPEGMLYYENRLDSWLALHPNFILDYKVTANYDSDNLVPTSVELQYVGIDHNGQLLDIRLGGGLEVTDNYGVTTVTLNNQSPLAVIDYKTGLLLEELLKQETPPVAAPATDPAVDTDTAPQTDTSREVHITRNGRSKVYWYHKINMPASTTFANVVTISEDEAIASGKHHSKRESQD
ncbi:DNA/RNA non-specific endonuclease [Streptococcus phocae subsp. phocae]